MKVFAKKRGDGVDEKRLKGSLDSLWTIDLVSFNM